MKKNRQTQSHNLGKPIMPIEKIEAQKVRAGVAYRLAVACCSPKLILPKDAINGRIRVNMSKHPKKADECQKSLSFCSWVRKNKSRQQSDHPRKRVVTVPQWVRLSDVPKKPPHT